jgi:RNA polymerase sigma factor (sigma-70 family)
MRGVMRRALTGDRDAFGCLYRLWRHYLLAVVRNRLPRRLRRLCDAEECLHSAVVVLLKHDWSGNTFDSPEQLLGYFTRATLSSVHDAEDEYLHAKGRCLEYQVSLTGDLPSASATTEHVLERRDWFERFFLTASLEARQVLQLMYEGTTSIKEIAEVMGCSYERVRGILNAERRRLIRDGEGPRGGREEGFAGERAAATRGEVAP